MTGSIPVDTREDRPSSERLLALHPNLTFDRAAAEKVLTERHWPRVAEALGKLPDATLRDLLETFRYDSSREEFLWYYIEAVTDEKAVHLKEY